MPVTDPDTQVFFVVPQTPLTGQACVLHASELAPLQVAPPLAGAGLVHVRV